MKIKQGNKAFLTEEMTGKRVVILSKTVQHYRVEFFNLLRKRLAEDGIELSVIYGQPESGEKSKSDTANLLWGTYRKNVHINIFGKVLYWQPVIKDVDRADLVIAEQASKLLVNYILILRYFAGKEKLALWGHGKNFQTHSADTLGEAIKRLFSRHVWWWFAYNESSAKVIRETGFESSRITVVKNSIDTKSLSSKLSSISLADRDNLKAELGIIGDNIGIYSGGMYKEKRIDFLIKSCMLIRQEIPDFNIIFIGSGNEAERVIRASKENTWIHYIGVKLNEDRVKYFSISKVFLMPGLVGLAVLDSFALETPIVTTKLDFHSPEFEYIDDGINGIVVAQSDSEAAYAHAVISLLKDDSRRAGMIQKGVASSKVYTVENMVENFHAGILNALK